MELMGQWAPGNEKDNSADKKGIGDNLGWFPFPMVEGGAGNPTDAMAAAAAGLSARMPPMQLWTSSSTSPARMCRKKWALWA